MASFDEVDVFAGRGDRFDWKIVGKKEVLIPYNSNGLHTPTKDSDVLMANHLNPDHVRWELHRVWVIESTLRAVSATRLPRAATTWTKTLGLLSWGTVGTAMASSGKPSGRTLS